MPIVGLEQTLFLSRRLMLAHVQLQWLYKEICEVCDSNQLGFFGRLLLTRVQLRALLKEICRERNLNQYSLILKSTPSTHSTTCATGCENGMVWSPHPSLATQLASLMPGKVD